MPNIFCSRHDLQTEADVEARLVNRLIDHLGYPPDKVRLKSSLERLPVPRGVRKEHFMPDYVLLAADDTPLIVLDAKSPAESCDEFRYQVGGYAYALNQRFPSMNPVEYVAISNGEETVVWPWDDQHPLVRVSFENHDPLDPSFQSLVRLLAFRTREEHLTSRSPSFAFIRPDIDVLIRVFYECHQIIWKKEALTPTDAFYEFAKIMFVKLREDNRIAEQIAEGQQPDETDFTFSVAWLRQQTALNISANPLADISFRRVREELENQIAAGSKKRIFDSGESLNLSADTISQIVERLQHFDLSGMDEDLNGRMFETFLNATVRGKDLGQFFTPRSVVKYMTKAAGLRVVREEIPNVLDGCCGSGGFLIEAMAELSHAIDERSDLTTAKRRELHGQLLRKHLWGIEKSQKIARLARLNMYLHGDGGSTIFAADTLDKQLSPPAGVSISQQQESEALRHQLDLEPGFDVILTNPPFSMSYKAANLDERNILSQYDLAKTATGKRSASEKSNVLFLERYRDLLRPGGDLITVIDNSVLNGINSDVYRQFIRKNFLIRQVISLPHNAFLRAAAGVQTSILHLQRRQENETQGPIFMAVINNIGHDDHQRETADRDNLSRLTELWHEWTKTGNLDEVFEPNSVATENLGCPFQVFQVNPEDLREDRLDAFAYAPELQRAQAAIRRNEQSGMVEILTAEKLNLVKPLSKIDLDRFGDDVIRYLEISDVTPDGSIVRWREDRVDALPTRARLQVRTGDVLFAKNISSRGTALIVPPDFDGHLATTGFLAVRPQSEDDGLLLWTLFTSETFRRQVFYLAVTAVQPEIRDEIFLKDILVPVPVDAELRAELVEAARQVQVRNEEIRSAMTDLRDIAEQAFERSGMRSGNE